MTVPPQSFYFQLRIYSPAVAGKVLSECRCFRTKKLKQYPILPNKGTGHFSKVRSDVMT